MSLQTDSIFIAAIQQDETIMKTIGSRLYGTAIPLPDEDADNEPVPYVIVSFDGMTNDTRTKDNGDIEGDEDRVTVTVEIAAETLDALHDLVASVRKTIREYVSTPDVSWDNYDEFPTDYDLSASAIQYDSDKPCYWQTMTYQCVTNNIKE